MSNIVVLISADTEWDALCDEYQPKELTKSPFGQWFSHREPEHLHHNDVVFLHGGWGKIAAAASAQYGIDRWQPGLLINAGTCGGFAGKIARGQLVVPRKTVVYDIEERMTDQNAVIRRYTTELDNKAFTPLLPKQTAQVVIATGDQDLDPGKTEFLYQQYGATVADWESGAIAYVARRNGVPLLILRVVTDLVSAENGEAYGQWEVYQAATQKYMREITAALRHLLQHLPGNA